MKHINIDTKIEMYNMKWLVSKVLDRYAYLFEFNNIFKPITFTDAFILYKTLFLQILVKRIRKERKTITEFLNKDLIVYNKYIDSYTLLKKGIPTGIPNFTLTEKDILLFIRDVVRKGDICIDIGANQGIYTLLLGRLIGEEGLCVAVEPSPKNFKILKTNIKINKLNNIIPINKGCSDCESEADLYEDRTGRCSSLDPSHLLESNISITDISKVKVEPLDNIVNKLKIDKIKLIKIDVERHELYVLRGALNTLKRTRYIIIETRDDTEKDVRSILEENGFKLVREDRIQTPKFRPYANLIYSK